MGRYRVKPGIGGAAPAREARNLALGRRRGSPGGTMAPRQELADAEPVRRFLRFEKDAESRTRKRGPAP